MTADCCPLHGCPSEGAEQRRSRQLLITCSVSLCRSYPAGSRSLQISTQTATAARPLEAYSSLVQLEEC